MQQTAMASFLQRFFLQVAVELEQAQPGSAKLFPESHMRGAKGLHSEGLPRGVQHHGPLPPDDVIVGQSHVHAAAHLQVQPCMHGHGICKCCL